MNKLIALTCVLTPILSTIFAFVLLLNSIFGWGWFLFLAFITSNQGRNLISSILENESSKKE